MSRKSLCHVDDIPDNGALERQLPGEPPVSLMLIRRGARVFAYHNVCPHAGRPLNWAPGQFLFTPQGNLVCAAHGATFVVENGLAVGGPCLGATLTPFPIEVRDGEVLDARAT